MSTKISLTLEYLSIPCRFENGQKDVIDLTSLGRTDRVPAFLDMTRIGPWSMLISPIYLSIFFKF